MEVMEAIKQRRSVRKYKPTPVSEHDLNTVLEAARWAPSWTNTQCWRFVVVRDAEIKAELAEALSWRFTVIHNAEVTAEPTEVSKSRNPATSAIRDAPVVIVVCAELGRSGYYKGSPGTDKGDWFMFDTALAMQNLALAACSLGLGTVHVGYFDAKKVAEILDVPEGVAVVEMTPLGYPEEQPAPTPRKELSELVSYDRYSRK